ncbi:MAG: apolipoprotein N-acyltransferase [Deltaproteobacteria bacterium RBG_19FT_COMBO_43_11]|nr:MAG: apolipoprotein N-acyltransferase [Deltaproteobacteria bacterium RBG_19FT_COMBO_43_11]
MNSYKDLKENEILLAVISGLFLFLSFPKYGFGFMAWVALIPLFFALRNVDSIKRALLLGFITGVAGYAGIIYWITYVVVNYGYLPLYLGFVIMLLLTCYLSIYIALFAAGIRFFRQKMILCLLAPSLWICLEYCKSTFLTGFPWENLGYSQYNNFYLIQCADVFGVFGLSFLIIMVNAAIFEVIVNKSKKTFITVAAAFLVLASVFIYGIIRVNQIDKEINKAQGMEVTLIQGNIDQSVKWNEKFQRKTLDTYERLSLQNVPASGGLLIWPETALPFNFDEESDFQVKVKNLPIRTKTWFVFGAVSYWPQRGGYTDFFNSAYLLSPDGEVQGKYDKVHLVPYGEYVPLRNFFPFIKKLTAGIGDFTAGEGFYPLLMKDKKIGILICYEGILPEAARMYKNQSARLLVNITNDAWFGVTSAPFQHFTMALFRAVETRLYLVRAANTGISGIIDPCGEIVAQTNIFEAQALKGNIKYLNIYSFYAKNGDILVVICFVLIIICFLFSWKGRLKNDGRKLARNSK